LNRDRKLEGRTAIVTGAAKGIGLTIADHLAGLGAQLVLADVDADALAGAAASIDTTHGGKTLTVSGDLALECTARAVVEGCVAAFGTVDILVNNAGGGVIRPFLEHTPETLRATIDRNLWTTLWCCWLALPVMRVRGYGRVINLGADSVRNGLWDHAAYNAAKGGVHALTTGLAREFAADGITVNTVAPCAVNTPQMQAITAANPALAAKFVSVIPLGRPAEMQEVASMVGYLASEEAAFVTGQVISVNGGSTML
jgi:2,3-dihydroxy-2,3-dihydro-p-cumate dehydrogenase